MKTITFDSVTVEEDGSVTITGQVSTAPTYGVPTTQTTVPDYPPNNKAFSRAVRASTEAVFSIRNGADHNVAVPLSSLKKLIIAVEPTQSYKPRFTAQPTAQTVATGDVGEFRVVADSELDDLAYEWQYEAQATGVVAASDQVSDGDTVTLGTVTYTFKDALTPAEGEVLIGADAAASLLNLIRAINHTGTPDTDYSVANQNFKATADTAVDTDHFTVTAIAEGDAGNTVVLSASGVALDAGGTNNANAVLDGGGWTAATGTVAGTAYTNGDTPTLNLSCATTGQTGLAHRCKASNGSGDSYSKEVTLTIT